MRDLACPPVPRFAARLGASCRTAIARGLMVLIVAAGAAVLLPAVGSADPLPANAPGDAAVDRAWSWVRSMLKTPTTIVSDSAITPDQPYPADWTGAVSGTFTLSGVAIPDVLPAAVTLDAASNLAASAPDYRGVVSGRVTLPAQANRWIIQVYRGTGETRTQVPLQTLVRPDGTFDLDLGGVTDPAPGEWQFGVLDASAGYAATGLPWPSAGTYLGWEVRSFVTTDRRYLIGTTPASADGTFHFTGSAPGTKTFQLVATAVQAAGDGQVLAEYAPTTGLARSFHSLDAGDQDRVTSYTYDQSLALQSALVMGDQQTADTLAAGLLSLQAADGAQAGGFISAAPQANPRGGQPRFLTGNNAIATYAILSYLGRAPESAAPAVRQAAEGAVEWLLGQQVTGGPMDGLLTGGFDGAVALPWASTEHNLDAWHALTLAATELDCGRCATAAAILRNSILTILWDSTNNRFAQGMQPGGLDTVEPLDVNAWGAVFLTSADRPDLAALALGRTQAFAVTDQGIAGFLAFRSQPSIPNPLPVIWLEGSFGVALAQARFGDRAAHDQTMSALLLAQRPDGSMPMASSADPVRELTTDSALAATTWFIQASRHDHPESLWAAH